MSDDMTFDKALKILDIEEYRERIWNSSSTGELMHLTQYIQFSHHGQVS